MEILIRQFLKNNNKNLYLLNNSTIIKPDYDNNIIRSMIYLF